MSSTSFYEINIDIIGLSETRLEKKTEDHELSIEGYKVFCNDRDSNGDGVAIYVVDSLPAPTVTRKSDKLELLSLEIKPTIARSFFIVCWYRPPTTSVDETAFENLRETLGILDKEGKEVILLVINCDFKDKRMVMQTNSNLSTQNIRWNS